MCNVEICFFFNDTATTEIYTLSLHDALPISSSFIGTIKDVIVNSTGFDTEFDIFLEMWKDQFPGKLSFSHNDSH